MLSYSLGLCVNIKHLLESDYIELVSLYLLDLSLPGSHSVCHLGVHIEIFILYTETKSWHLIAL